MIARQWQYLLKRAPSITVWNIFILLNTAALAAEVSQQKNALKPILSVQMRCLVIWLSSSAFPAHGFHGALRAERERWDTSLQIEFQGDLFTDVSVRELFCHEVRIESIFKSTVLHGFMGCVENYETAECKSPSKSHLMLFAPRGAAPPEAGRHQRRAPQRVTSCWLTALSTPTWTDPLPESSGLSHHVSCTKL